MTSKIVRWVAVWLAVGLAAAQTVSSTTPSDSTFSIVLGSCSTSGTPDVDPVAVQTCTSTLTISRVVGPGSGSANINPDGTLVNPNQYVANGVVGATASLHWVADASGYAGSTVTLTVAVNGTQVATGFAPVLTTVSGYTDIPIGSLRFGQIVNGANQPGVNQVTTVTVVQFTPQPVLPTDRRAPTPSLRPTPKDRRPSSAGAQSVSFKAMYPIVLVHGWNSGPWDWGPAPSSSPCPANPDPTAHTDGQLNFVQAFIDAEAPFDCSIVINPQATNDGGAQILQSQVPVILSKFGTRHVNLVAHSKGGLWMRGFLQLNANQTDQTQTIGVISATTLETPHYGTVLASTVAHFNRPGFSAAMIWYIRTFGLSLGFLGHGADDMTPQGLVAFNNRNQTPPPMFYLMDATGNSFTTKPSYYSTSADADRNDDGTITGAEASPPYSQLFANFAYQVIARNQPVTTITVASIRSFQTAPRSSGYFLSDCLVPIYSAQYPMFQQINLYQGNACSSLSLTCGRNHGTIRTPDVAALVLQNIVAAESSQP
jgi:hypothetical protein